MALGGREEVATIVLLPPKKWNQEGGKVKNVKILHRDSKGELARHQLENNNASGYLRGALERAGYQYDIQNGVVVENEKDSRRVKS